MGWHQDHGFALQAKAMVKNIEIFRFPKNAEIYIYLMLKSIPNHANLPSAVAVELITRENMFTPVNTIQVFKTRFESKKPYDQKVKERETVHLTIFDCGLYCNEKKIYLIISCNAL